MTFLYELSVPRTINFQHYLTDPTGERIDQLAGANATRGAMRRILKECKQNSGNQDWFKAVKLIEDYLPRLLGLMHAVENDNLLMPSQIMFSWKPTLSSRRVPSASKISIPSFYYELAFVLLNLGLALSNTSNAVISSMGSYEFGTEPDRRAGDEKISSAADTLCRASGLFEFLSRDVVPKWEKQSPDGVVQLRASRPPELSREATSGLAQQALADAERLAIRRLLSRSTMDRHANPGAGLPQSHPSPALLAKLELNVNQLYSGAKDAFKLASGAGEFSHSLQNYVNENRQLSLGRSYKWLALEAGEQAGQNGEALGWLSLSHETLKSIGSDSVLAIRNRALNSNLTRNKAQVQQELEEIDKFLKAYEQLNRNVTFELIPPAATLLARVPGGRAALSAKMYTLPAPLQRNFGSFSSSSVLDDADSDEEDAPTSLKDHAQAYC